DAWVVYVLYESDHYFIWISRRSLGDLLTFAFSLIDFLMNSAKNHCFVSKCDYYCDTTHAICGKPDMKEGSVQVFLPDENNVPRKHNKSPYRRTYSKRNQVAAWQQDMEFCTTKVKTRAQYAHGRRLLDLIDLHIMDYLIGGIDLFLLSEV
uniref:FAM20 C-terminal domain-containing protein n=1 Tax=Parascaris equorum TaxID=6256 RepID=A0A914R8D4_PAREQ